MALDQLDPVTLTVIIFAFILAGMSKGVIGFGLPLIAIPIVASVVPVPIAIALTLAPIFFSNAFQTFHGGRAGQVLRRFWPVVVTMFLGVLAGAQILARADHDAIAILIGVLLLVFVTMQFLSLRPSVPPRAERWLSPALGLFSGVVGGVSSMFGPLLIIYLVALRLEKDDFISTIGMFYLTGVVTLWSSLAVMGVIAFNEIVGSLLVCIPLYCGLFFGTWLRGRISQALFQRALTIALIFVGLNLIRRGIM
jgi:hypothetical protein